MSISFAFFPLQYFRVEKFQTIQASSVAGEYPHLHNNNDKCITWYILKEEQN